MGRLCLSVALAIVSALLVSVLVIQHRHTGTDGHQTDVVLVTDSQTFGNVRVGTEVTVEYSIQNISPVPVRLLGGADLCQSEGCARVEGAFPIVVAPGQQAPVKLVFRPAKVGECDIQVPVYTDVLNNPSFKLRLTGRATE